MMATFVSFSLLSVLFFHPVITVVIRESSPSRDTIIAVSSSDPDFEKYFFFNHPALGSEYASSGLSATAKTFPDDGFDRPFTVVGPGQAIAGTGRGFVSASNMLPLFFMPSNFVGFGLNNFNGANWIKRIGELFNPSLISNGEVRTVTAVNDNGRVYGEVKTVTLDDKGKSHAVTSVIN